MRKLLIVLAILYTVVLSLNYIIGVLQPHDNLVFLGSVHYPMDYFYYLSQFIQGKTRWFSAVDLYTSDFKGATLVGATNVFTGHILSFFGIGPIVGYEVALTIYTLFLLLLSAFFLMRLFPKRSHGPLIAFILFAVANLVPGAGSFYANVTEPLVRFSRVPHQMLGQGCILAAMLIVLYWTTKNMKLSTKIMFSLLAALCGVTLANINPVQWLLTVCVMFFAMFVHALISHQKKWSSFIIPALFAIAGLPMTLYLTHVFDALPFSQSASWESWQQIRLPPLDAIGAFGPVAILGLVGLPIFLKKPTLPRLLIATYTVASVLLFFSPVSAWGKITNVRFLSAITVLGESALAADFLLNIPIADIKNRLLAAWTLVFALVIILIPVGIQQFWGHANLNTNNAYIYVSPLVIETFSQIQKLTTDKDIILATWPYDSSFPALTGRRGFMGHMHLTIDPDRKNREAYLFFAALEDDAAMHKFLTDNGITYVLEFSAVTKMVEPFLSVSYQSPLLTLYKVVP